MKIEVEDEDCENFRERENRRKYGGIIEYSTAGGSIKWDSY